MGQIIIIMIKLITDLQNYMIDEIFRDTHTIPHSNIIFICLCTYIALHHTTITHAAIFDDECTFPGIVRLNPILMLCNVKLSPHQKISTVNPGRIKCPTIKQ